MDTRTGEIMSLAEVDKLPPDERKHFLPVSRDTTTHERFYKQIMLYNPCGCGSGKKFKFCCKGKTSIYVPDPSKPTTEAGKEVGPRTDGGG